MSKRRPEGTQSWREYKKSRMPTNIAILGWGSLLWDERPEFEAQHGPWQFDGPQIRIEFSRVSQTRRGALTLVVDPAHGASCRVAHTTSKRQDAEAAINDLRLREGTSRSNIGFYFVDGASSQSKDSVTLAAIKVWATAKAVDGVVWTDLASNFEKECECEFSVENALAYLRLLDANAKTLAVEYFSKAPAVVQTPLRAAVRAEPWFQGVTAVLPRNDDGRPAIGEDVIAAYEATHYEVGTGTPTSFVLRIGQLSVPAVRLLRERGAASGAFLTAANPFSRQLSESENAARNAALVQRAHELGLHQIPGVGRSADRTWEEQSVFLCGATVDQANLLADEFQQNAYVWVDSDGCPSLVLRS